ncbi:MAG: HipA domain-containing protein [Leptospirillum sp.]
MNRLVVKRGETFIGTLEETDKGTLFRYSAEWLKSGNAVPLSDFLPLENTDFPEEVHRSFFGNLIMEGRERELIGKAFHVSNIFGFLRLFGRDLIGGYTVEEISPSGQPRYIPVDRSILKSFLNKGFVSVMNAFEGYRISLSGAQEKFAIFLDAHGDFCIPVHGAPSSHILKPDIYGARSVSKSALNESFIMSLAGRVGIPVAEVSFERDLNATLVKRFDRTFNGDGSVNRLPQLDVCQCLGIGQEKKYEEEGGPSFAEIVKLVKKNGTDPGKDCLGLLKWIVFSALCGNMDGHSKNISFYYKKGALSLTPFYDMMNTFIYEKTSRTLAFKIGGESRPNCLTAIHWIRLSKDIGHSPKATEGIVRKMATGIDRHIADVASHPQFLSVDRKEREFLERIGKDILSRSNKWLKSLNNSQPSSG